MAALSAALQDACVSEGLGRLQQQAAEAPATAAAAGIQVQTPQLTWQDELSQHTRPRKPQLTLALAPA
jgi:hypothetical protein